MIDLNEKMVAALNQQIAYEGYASNFYLSLAYWCDDQALNGCKAFFIRQAEEEREHMLKIYEYMSDCGFHPVTPGFEQPPSDFENIVEIFNKVFEQERFVTASIHALLKLSIDLNDYNTQSFLKWYVDEQREEEAVIRTIQDRIKVIGQGGQWLYYIDKEVEKINTQLMAAEGIDAEEG